MHPLARDPKLVGDLGRRHQLRRRRSLGPAKQLGFGNDLHTDRLGRHYVLYDIRQFPA